MKNQQARGGGNKNVCKIENCHFIQNNITLFLRIYDEYWGGFSGQTVFQKTNCFNLSATLCLSSFSLWSLLYMWRSDGLSRVKTLSLDSELESDS